MEHDYLIVGAGAAGAVVASRLSEDTRKSVVLLEAGQDLTPGKEPADIRNVFPLSAFNRDYMWPDTRVHWLDASHSPAVPLPQGRVLGGSSAVMGMWAPRGRPEDYEEWKATGAANWGWDDVLPYFRKLETDFDFDGLLHGRDGPIPIRREPKAEWSPFPRAVYDTLMHQGDRHIEDMNADFRDGHCSLPVSRFERSRGSAGLCYLGAAVRARPNLTVLTLHTVKRLAMQGTRIVGATALRPDGTVETIHARETLLAAGALRTPALMLRSGIGDGRQIQRAGLALVADRPGVGRNLQNHAVMYAAAVLRLNGREPRGWRPAGSTYVRYTSGERGCTPGDMAIYVRSYLTWHALGRRMASLAPTVMKPAARGTVTLDAASPDNPPTIEFCFHSDPRDVDRLKAGLRRALQIFASNEVRKVCRDAFLLRDPSRLMKFNHVSSLNAVRAWAAATVLDCVPGMEKGILSRSKFIDDDAPLLADEARLTEFVRDNVTGTGHVCGTCRMGRAGDPEAVVDGAGRVYGVDGLRVVDASVMPTVPSGNTHIPTIMVAEKMADSIRR